ncbi:DsbA family protein [Rummeliibacillus stabekisii]|uniref:DsbA family protein n=1 Tax=Rummeliibacillus stabekisii TaxID=241244 RepID=UPI00371D2071
MKIKGLLISLSLVMVAAGCQSTSAKEETVKVETNVASTEHTAEDNHQVFDIDVNGRPILGKEDAKNTIVLAFDYSCPWCTQWFNNVLPKIENKFIETGKAKFVSQPLAILNQDSLFMTKVDQFVELKHPSKYYKVQQKFESRANKAEVDWANEDYILSTLESVGINTTIESINKTGQGGFKITSKYTEDYGVDSVPTVYINGAKMEDPFDLKEMNQLLDKGGDK